MLGAGSGRGAWCGILNQTPEGLTHQAKGPGLDPVHRCSLTFPTSRHLRIMMLSVLGWMGAALGAQGGRGDPLKALAGTCAGGWVVGGLKEATQGPEP